MIKLLRTIISSTIIILVVSEVCFSQTGDTIPDTERGMYSFMKLKDGLIKQEIAYFNIASSLITETTNISKLKVNEISVRTCTDSSASFSNGDITVQINSTKFDAQKHNLLYDNSPGKYLALIDNKPFWGTDGGIPKEKIKSIVFEHMKYQMNLPDNAIDDLFEPNFCTKNRQTGITTFHCKVYRSDDKRRVYVYMVNGDGAGGYEVTWVIQDSKYYTRVVDYGF